MLRQRIAPYYFIVLEGKFSKALEIVKAGKFDLKRTKEIDERNFMPMQGWRLTL